MIKLKPCPFCGYFSLYHNFQVVCKKCNSQADNSIIWNMRYEEESCMDKTETKESKTEM